MKRWAFYRIFVIVTMFAKYIYVIYRFSRKHRGTNNEEFERLMIGIARDYKKKALRLEGLLIKLGQFLSIRADLFPPSVLLELTELIDRVPSSKLKESRAIMEEDWAMPIEDVVTDISPKPIASASIGEVYSAILKSNGKKVAIKVQRPNIEKIIHTDFRAMRIVIAMLRRTALNKSTDLQSLYRQMVFVIGDELNFQTELKNALYFKQVYENSPDIEIPDYYEEFCTNRVLVMDFVEAARITDLDFLEKHGIDREDLARRLFLNAGEQLLFGGKFHADPHPGNVLVRADGKIILLDFGMVGSTTPQDMQAIRGILQSFVTLDYDSIVDGLEELRFLLPNANKQNIRQAIERAVNFYLETNLEQVDTRVIEKVLSDIELLVRNEPIQLPAEFAFFGRAVSTLLGILQILSPHINFLEIGKPMVKRWLESEGRTQNRYLKIAGTYGARFLSLPRLVNEALAEPTRFRLFEQQKFARNANIESLKIRQWTSSLVGIVSLPAGYAGYYLAVYEMMGAALLVAVVALWNGRRIGRQIVRLADSPFK
ncbi:ABC1 kinase family protein [Exiguobacterium flavidum]|uniref:ABC1 kinase family protein n=1 Tax=Exiguobacterium flavidum TaxID=2184695 RepID=UPI000DF77E1B|nr:AarF/UbiB family protein [Exiguobacterium flavidum]